MPPSIIIVGLGPGGAELWTEAARTILTSADEVWLRTTRHPGTQTLTGQKKTQSFDNWYEEADDFDTLYNRIAAHIVKLGAREQGVIYAVPGHPSVGEATVSKIRSLAAEAGLPVVIVPGLSFIEPTLDALGLDALDGLQIADAAQLAAMHHPPLDPDRPALVAQLYNQRQAAQVKLTLMNAYPDEHQVSLIRAVAPADPAGVDNERQQVITCSLFELDRQPTIDHLTTLYLPPLPAPSGLPALQETVAHLRAPDGCPWDREQTHQSLRPYLLEETHEVLAALDAEDMRLLTEEMGDLLLQIVLHAQIAAETEEFQMADVIAYVDAKLRRRHPHVFGDVVVSGVDEVLTNWELIKRTEHNDKENVTPLEKSALDGVPSTLPALAYAQKISQKAVRVGFEWPTVDGVLDKLTEEAHEVATAQTHQEREAEIGDLLFVVVNLARWLGVDAESALRTTNIRFTQRFRIVERLARERNITLSDLDIDALDSLWEEAKDEMSTQEAY